MFSRSDLKSEEGLNAQGQGDAMNRNLVHGKQPHSLRYRPFHVRNVSVEEHAHSLEDKFLLNPLDRQNSLVPVEIRTILLDEA